MVKTEVPVTEDIQELVPLFIKCRKDNIQEYESSLKTKDYIAIKKVAHTVKGIAVPYGFPKLQDMMKEVEEAASRGDEPRLTELLHKFKNYVNEFE